MSQAADQRHAHQLRLVALVARSVRGMQLDPSDVTGSWQAAAPAVLRVVVAAQVAAAGEAEAYTALALDEQGVDVDPEGIVTAAAFVGVAGDGRPLLTLADVPRVAALIRIRDGVEPGPALRSAVAQLDRMMVTAVQDAGRAAESVAITTRRGVGYVRMLNPPSCSRCVILAGKFYRWNSGFLRHPRDKCRHIPATEDTADDLRTDPAAYVRGLTAADRERLLGKAGAEAFGDGADLGQVINSRRGMATASAGGRLLPITTAGRGPARGPRLMPEAIYRLAADRDDAIRRLRANSYIT